MSDGATEGETAVTIVMITCKKCDERGECWVRAPGALWFGPYCIQHAQEERDRQMEWSELLASERAHG